jgi:hypothetical protein
MGSLMRSFEDLHKSIDKFRTSGRVKSRFKGHFGLVKKMSNFTIGKDKMISHPANKLMRASSQPMIHQSPSGNPIFVYEKMSGTAEG